MVEFYKFEIKYDNTDMKKGGQMEDLRRHKSMVQVVKFN